MSTPDFSQLENLKVRPTATAEYTFFQIEDEPVLKVRPASEVNKPYLNAVLRLGRSTLRKMRGGKISTAVLEENREQDRKLFAKYVVLEWKNVKDAKGEEVSFSKEACEAFLRALPNDIFDDLRVFCGDIDNFRKENELAEDDISELEGN